MSKSGGGAVAPPAPPSPTPQHRHEIYKVGMWVKNAVKSPLEGTMLIESLPQAILKI